MFVTSSGKFQQKFQFSEPTHKAKGSVCHQFRIRQKQCFSALQEVKIFLFVNRKHMRISSGESPAATNQKVRCQTTVYGSYTMGYSTSHMAPLGIEYVDLINYRITKQRNQPGTSLDLVWILARAKFNADQTRKFHTADHSIFGHNF